MLIIISTTLTMVFIGDKLPLRIKDQFHKLSSAGIAEYCVWKCLNILQGKHLSVPVSSQKSCSAVALPCVRAPLMMIFNCYCFWLRKELSFTIKSTMEWRNPIFCICHSGKTWITYDSFLLHQGVPVRHCRNTCGQLQQKVEKLSLKGIIFMSPSAAVQKGLLLLLANGVVVKARAIKSAQKNNAATQTQTQKSTTVLF